jgi:hypothetical protein
MFLITLYEIPSELYEAIYDVLIVHYSIIVHRNNFVRRYSNVVNDVQIHFLQKSINPCSTTYGNVHFEQISQHFSNFLTMF